MALKFEECVLTRLKSEQVHPSPVIDFFSSNI